MLGVAHPQWRTRLAKQARRLPSMQGVDAIAAQLIALRGRPPCCAAPRDPRRHRGHRRVHRAPERRRPAHALHGHRHAGPPHLPQRLRRLYDETLDYRQHAAFIVELDGEIIGVAHAFRIGDDGTYEVSFSRRSDLRGQGIGRHLMQMLIDWGARAGAHGYYATTYRHENPRMRALFDRFGFVAKADPDDPRR
jgi:RimJ/RimL family protein N-acetyltransferase